MKGTFGFCGDASTYQTKIEVFQREIVDAYVASRRKNVVDKQFQEENKIFFLAHSNNFVKKLVRVYGQQKGQD